jgi:tetratricopeptide (TPR) repeat protein
MTLTLALALLPLLFDIVHLQNGGQIEGKVIDRSGGKVRIQTRYGVVTIDESEVARVEEKPWDPPDKPGDKTAAPSKPKEPPRLGNTFREPWLNFRITLPIKWEPVKSDVGASLAFAGPKDGLYTPRVEIYIEANKDELLDFVQKHEAQVKSKPDAQGLKFKVLALEDFGKSRACHAVATFTDGLVNYKTVWFFVDAAGRKVTMVWTCFDKLADRYEELVLASMRSFRIFDPNPTTSAKQARFSQLVKEATELRQAKKHGEALKKLEEAAGLAPAFPEAYNQLGEAAGNARDYVAAEKWFRKAAGIDPENFTYALNVSLILHTRKKDDEALPFAEQAVKLDPAHPQAHLQLAAVRLRLRDLAGAEAAYGRALELDPESVEGHYGLGVTLEAQGKAEAAAREYRDTLRLDPNHQGAKDGLVRARDN